VAYSAHGSLLILLAAESWTREVQDAIFARDDLGARAGDGGAWCGGGGPRVLRCLNIFNAGLRKNSLGMCRPMMSHLVN
jgi:hypothetical protein